MVKRLQEPGSPGPWSEVLGRGRGTKRRRGAPGAPDEDPPSPGPWPAPLSHTLDLSFAAGSAESVLREVSRATQREGRPQTKYELQGVDPLEAKLKLDSARSHCRCRKPSAGQWSCCTGLMSGNLAAVRGAYWRLTAEERAHLVRCLYHAAAGFPQSEWGETAFRGPGSQSHKSTKWHICGKRVCFSAFAHLLGHTERTLIKMVNGLPDCRSFQKRARGAPGAEAVDYFFYETYLSAAEPLPTALARRRPGPRASKALPKPANKSPAGQSVDADIQFDEGPWLQAGDPTNPEEDADDQDTLEWNPDAATAAVLEKLTVACHERPTGVRRRFLPHMRLHDLYWVFLASASVLSEAAEAPGAPGAPGPLWQPPSFKTFARRWSSVWSHFLRFRKVSQHAQCTTCFDLQQVMHSRAPGGGNADTWLLRMEAARALKEHYKQQYLDRCIYWSCRWASRSGQDVLCVIIDSPDKTHFAWPRWPWARLPKSLDGLIRPRLAVTGVLAHGYLGALHFADENVSHGSDAFCEVLMLTLVRVAELCRKRGKRFPRHLVIQSDNTVAQAKNSFVTSFLASLVHLGYFSSATINFLMVGHTHEDIDQLFGLMVEWLSRRHSWETPEAVMQFLREKMSRHFLDRGEQFVVERLSAVRDYQAWLEMGTSKLYNAFGTRGGIEAPHSFSFKRRRDLSRSEWSVKMEDELSLEEQIRAPGAPVASDSDVFCSVKTYMRDLTLQQAPVLVIQVAEVGVRAPRPMTVLQVAQRNLQTETNKQTCDQLEATQTGQALDAENLGDTADPGSPVHQGVPDAPGCSCSAPTGHGAALPLASPELAGGGAGGPPPGPGGVQEPLLPAPP